MVAEAAVAAVLVHVVDEVNVPTAGRDLRVLDGVEERHIPVTEAPEVNLRRSARSDHETELAARSPGGADADANSSFSVGGSSRKKSYYKKTVPCPGVSITKKNMPFFLYAFSRAAKTPKWQPTFSLISKVFGHV